MSPAAAACEADGGAVDHISDLSDDLLLHVLRFLPDARDVICASALSTRWRNLWTRAPVLRLRLGNWNRNGQSAKENEARFNDFVHNVLARRAYGYGGADTNIDTLVLRAWGLWPGKSRVEVWLGRLLSSPSCCPRLRKLELSHLHGLNDLRLDGGALETLHLADLAVRRLDVDAPRLSALDVESYFMHQQYNEHTSLTVRAPALKKLEYSLALGNIQLQLQLDFGSRLAMGPVVQTDYHFIKRYVKHHKYNTCHDI